MTLIEETSTATTEVRWRDLSARRGRNELPQILVDAVLEDEILTDPDDIAEAIDQSWTTAEFPEQMVDADDWEILFSRTGFIRNGKRVERPTGKMVLFRGAIESRQAGMSWTGDLKVAAWFANRFNGMAGDTGHVYRVTVDPYDLLGHFTERNEDEYVIFPHEGLDIHKLS